MEDTTQTCNSELAFLWEVSCAVSTQGDSQTLLNELKKVFEKYFSIKNLQIFVREESSSALHDFVKSWIVIQKNQQQELVEKIFNNLKKSSDNSFILNNKLLKFSNHKSLIPSFLETVKEETNLLYFPVVNEKEIVGVIEINFDSINKDTKSFDFLTALRIAISQISSAVVNRMLNKHLCENIKFQNAMKSIAKLIETQFELDYILPIIGELIDRFISDHLIYIFTKDENNSFKLFWPLDCQDEKVLTLVEKMNKDKKQDKSSLLSKDGKAGVWAIRNEEKTVGLIAASSNIDKLSTYDIEYLTQFTQQASITTQRANSYAEVLKFATLDALTGLNNRRQFETRLRQETSIAKRSKKPLCCIMTDIDYFKKVNDTWGHSAGDCILKNVASIISSCLREYDIASRYGGEEFCILLPDTKINEAVFVAQRLRQAVESTPINISNDQLLGNDALNVTISIGVSEFDCENDSPEKLHQNADIALYEAKHRGRNRVVAYDDSLNT